MEKRTVTKCLTCGGAVTSPPVGRPRLYCSPLCRREAEYRLRRVQGHLARAERLLAGAELAEQTASPYAPFGIHPTPAEIAKTRASFWAQQVEALSAELRTLLAGLSTEDGEEDHG